MKNTKFKFGLYVAVAILCQSSFVLCSAAVDEQGAAAAQGRTHIRVELEAPEKAMLGKLTMGIRMSAGSVSKILEYYKAFHMSLHEVAKLQMQKKNRASDDGLEDVESADNAEFDAANEHVMCQEIINKLKKNLGPSAFKTAHQNSGKLHSVIHKLIRARFERPNFESKCMAFLTMPADNLEARIEKFFTDIKTFTALKQLLSELTTVLEGLKTHLPGGEKLFEKLVPPTPVELVNAQEQAAS